MGSGGQPHVVFIAFPFGTHAAPLFSLARAVSSASPSATISFLSTARSLASLPSSDTAIGHLHLVTVSDGTNPATPPPSNVEELIGLFLAATPGTLRDGMGAAAAVASGLQVTCVVSDAFLWMAGDVAEAMGVPWVPVWTGGPAALSGHIYTDSLRDAFGINDESKADESLHFVPGLGGYRVRDLPDGVVFGRSIYSPMSSLLHRMGQRLPKAAACLVCNTMQGLDPAIDDDFEAKFSKYLSLGPFHLLPSARSETSPDPSGCLSWLDGRAPASVVYVSFGSVMTPPKAEIAELAAGIEASRVPFLWSLRENLRDVLPPGFMDQTKERGLIVNWAPQLDVLGHNSIGAFMTHCGWNSVIEGIAAGVPMICRPIFGDQQMNARSVEDFWKIGVGFEGGKMTKDGVVRVLDVVLKGVEGNRMKARSGELKNVAVFAVAPSGSSTKNFKSLLDLLCGF